MKAPRSVLVTAVLAVLVTVGALVTVMVLRSQRDAQGIGPDRTPTPTTSTDAAEICGTRRCEVLTSAPLGLTTVQLLADVNGRNGRLRVLRGASSTVLEMAAAEMGLTQQSLVCAKGPISACLVSGAYQGGVAGEVFVDGERGWEFPEPHLSTAGYVDLMQVTGDETPDVVVATQPDCDGSAAECAGAPIVLEVFALDGKSLGCTQPYAALTQLPVQLDGVALQQCG